MRNRKNCLAVLLMTTIVVMGCGNQQVEKENPSAVSERASNVQDESEDGDVYKRQRPKSVTQPFTEGAAEGGTDNWGEVVTR